MQIAKIAENYVIVSKSSDFAIHTRTTKQRFQISPTQNTGYVWTEPISAETFSGFQIYPDTCGRGPQQKKILGFETIRLYINSSVVSTSINEMLPIIVRAHPIRLQFKIWNLTCAKFQIRHSKFCILLASLGITFILFSIWFRQFDNQIIIKQYEEFLRGMEHASLAL